MSEKTHDRHRKWMGEAFALALSVKGSTWPNPPVGAVLVTNGEIVGRGATSPAGGPHAELHCLEDAGERAAGASMYVSLEPCSHYGKTPPCTEAIIAAGVSAVYVACRDPNPEVNGNGIAALSRAGIRTVDGLMEEEALAINREFFTSVNSGRPYIHLKYAMTLDGRIAAETGDARWISGEHSRERVHQYRKQYQAVMVGRRTLELDDPALTCRLDDVPDKFQPQPVVLSASGDLGDRAKILCGPRKPLLITTVAGADRLRRMIPEDKVCLEVIDSNEKIFSAAAVARALARQNIVSVLVEGGPQIHTLFLREKLVDWLSVFIAPRMIGQGYSPLGSLGKRLMDDALACQGSWEMLGNDILFEGKLV